MRINAELSEYLKKNDLKKYIYSVFIVGSYLDNKTNTISDIDIVIIGNESNRVTQINFLGSIFSDFFKNQHNKEFVFFAEPSFEKIYYANNNCHDKLLIHLIYHPIDRFKRYIDSSDFILFNWQQNYELIYGSDMLKRQSPIVKTLSNDTLHSIYDNLIQQIQNCFLITTIEFSYFYYLKTYRYCLKTLNSIYTFLKYENIEHLNYNKLIEDQNPQLLLDKINQLESILCSEKDKLSTTGNYL